MLERKQVLLCRFYRSIITYTQALSYATLQTQKHALRLLIAAIVYLFYYTLGGLV